VNDVVVHESEPRAAFKMFEMAEMPCEQIIEADHIMPG
jgi:hypothetical protein